MFLWYKEEAFAHHESIPAVVLLMMLYGWAVIPLVYTVSFSFNTPGSACVKLVVMLTFLSISPVVLVTVTSEKGKGITLTFCREQESLLQQPLQLSHPQKLVSNQRHKR